MKKNKILLTTFLLAIMACNNAFAQDSEFDLTSQRSELQDVLTVPGHKIENRDLVINPVPHKITVDKQKTLDINQGFVLKGKQSQFANDLSFVLPAKKGKELYIDYGSEIARKNNVEPVSGAYTLIVDNKGIKIIGYDARGAFYGIQTLEQILKSAITKTGSLPYLTVNDYPDLPLRGVVEGFYGTPWSHEVRLSLIDFYGKYKMNTYLYGPKDDPYHSSPNWRLPYPANEASNIKQLVEACNKNYVDFVWAIHPGKDIRWNEEDYVNLLNKFDMMYDLGVRSFAIFFDDIEGEGTNPIKQTELLNRLNTDFVKSKGDVSSLIVCPTDYSKLWANPTPQGSLTLYGNTLDSSIEVFWTGDAVCSDLTKETMDWVNSRIKRPGFYWWNYPVTDYVRNIIMQGPVYGLETSLTKNDLSGLVSNPMEHGEASKLALYGVADYTWNIADYNPIDNWERAFDVVAPEVKDAYRTFAIHSTDTETGYRRDESWETKTFRLNDHYTQSAFDSLLQEFKKIENVPSIIEQNCENQLLVDELRPWLNQFGKLGTRGKNTLQLMKMYNDATPDQFWTAFVQNIMTEEEKQAYEKHKSGTMKLQPFYQNGMDDMVHGYYTKLTGQIPSVSKGIGSINNLYTPQSKWMFDSDTTTYYTSGKAQKSGDWIGVDLGTVKEIYEVSILQGRNSIDDVDYFDHAIVEYSADGKNWIPMTDSLTKVYDIYWKKEPVKGRYVRLKRLDSDKTNWVSVRSFEVNPIQIDQLGFKLKADNLQAALYAFDQDPASSYLSKGTLSFDVLNGISEYIVLQKVPSSVTIQQYTDQGSLISEEKISDSFLKIIPNKKAKTISIVGETEIFEIIPVK